MIIWFTGQPGSGKTTLAKALMDQCCSSIGKGDIAQGRLNGTLCQWLHLDGDHFRDIFDNKDYSERGRRNNVNNAMMMALYLNSIGIVPVCSFVSPYRDMREQLKQKALVAEIFLDYKGERNKDAFFVSGYQPPEADCLHLNTSQLTIAECLEAAVGYINDKAKLGKSSMQAQVQFAGTARIR